MVIFHDDPEKYNSPAMLKKLEDEVIVQISDLIMVGASRVGARDFILLLFIISCVSPHITPTNVGKVF